ncbi:F-box/kelch-repeat protein At1g57790-like [Coffea eugenioides]|uniref:F-box/kelch-repeat protein At1g57790-like n=1 Tax=Coffea arabica TaxID=13443 RepID=A0A6P6S535_COFAR|nr:F-box/kelch-repeat protein At1g57790-like [Coffea arabica]XP_027061026.1 F-box/kelch-repeat protein At1g57790-like [Coffea arabica]XP_027172299.1 F-box/kelch-repeat protein At1g57790-like [Coffea eugenioides]
MVLILAAAKQWRCMSPIVELEKHILSLWLMLPSTIERVECLVDPKLGVEHKYNIRMPQVIEEAMICYSKDGWLLMSRDKSWKLYNPLTKSIMCLLDSRPHCQTYYFSSLPNFSDCIVIAISFFPELEAVSLTRPWMSEWIAVELYKEENDGVYLRQTHFHPVFLHYYFYFLGENDCLGVVKLENSYATLTVHKLRRPCSAYDENFLVECGGEILAVFVGKAGGWL